MIHYALQVQEAIDYICRGERPSRSEGVSAGDETSRDETSRSTTGGEQKTVVKVKPRRKNRTVISIAHRPSTVEGCDRIICMVRGGMSEVRGSYDIRFGDSAHGQEAVSVDCIAIALEEQQKGEVTGQDTIHIEDEETSKGRGDIAHYEKQFSAAGQLKGGQPRLRKGDFVRVTGGVTGATGGGDGTRAATRVGRVIKYNRDGVPESGSPAEVKKLGGLYSSYLSKGNGSTAETSPLNASPPQTLVQTAALINGDADLETDPAPSDRDTQLKDGVDTQLKDDVDLKVWLSKMQHRWRAQPGDDWFVWHTVYTTHHALMYYMGVSPCTDTRYTDTPYTIHYTPYTIHYTLYTIHYTLYTIHHTLYTIHYTPYTIHHTLYIIHYTLYTIHYTTYAICHTRFTIHYTPFTRTLVHHSLYRRRVVSAFPLRAARPPHHAAGAGKDARAAPCTIRTARPPPRRHLWTHRSRCR
jgi:hypothetical protein